MALGTAQTPTYPVKDRQVRVDFTPSTSVNFIRIWVTDAPEGSSAKRSLDEKGAARLKVHEGDAEKPWHYTPDASGVFVFTAQEYTLKSANFGGDYKDDPDGHKEETKVGGEQTIYIRTGTKLTMPIGTGEDRSTLNLWIWASTIRPTTVELHGEKTPSITGGSTTRAQTAAVDPDVVTALAALENISSQDALGTLSTTIASYITDLNAHMANASSHASADTDNTIPAGFFSPSDAKGLLAAAQRFIKALRAHMDSDSGSGVGTGSWHQFGGVDFADLKNTLFVDPPSDMAGVVAALADAFRAYEAHRLETLYHSGGADTTNTFTTPLKPLLEVHRAYMASLRSILPTVPQTVNAGVPLLVNSAGMKEES